MLAVLLKLIPGKDWIYGTIIVAILAIFGWYTYHERTIGEQTIEAKNKAISDATVVHNKEVTDLATTQISKALEDYKASKSAPTLPAPSLVCHTISSSTAVSKSSSTPKGSNGSTNLPEESEGPPFNPSPGILANDRDADAQVKLLQDYVVACQNAGLCDKGK